MYTALKKIIGITGGIGGGKTTLSNRLRKAGYPVYDTDLEAKRLQNEDPELIAAIKDLLGPDVYVDNSLDRPAVAARVFSNQTLLGRLTRLVHPVVKRDFMKWVSLQQSPLVFIESAVLFEGGFDTLTTKNIVVTAPEEIRIERVMHRDQLTREQVVKRINNQLPEPDKEARADLVIYTDTGLPPDELLKKVLSEL